MGILTNVRMLLLCLASMTTLHGQLDAREIIRHAVAADELNWRPARNELPGASEFRLAGEGTLEGHSIFIIEAVPRLGYQPRSSTAKLFRSVKGSRVWPSDRLQVFASARLGLLKARRIEQTTHYSRYSSVPADARAIRPAEGLDARGAGLSQFAKGTP